MLTLTIGATQRASKSTLLCAIMMFGFLSLSAQNKDKIYLNAESAFYDEDFEDAIFLYNEVIALDEKFKDATYKVEICSLLLEENRERPLDVILSFAEMKSKYDKFYYYWMGRIYASKYMFPEAVDAWKQFLGKKAYKSKEIVNETKDFIKETELLVSYFDNPDNYEVHQLESGINTKFGEFSPVYFEETKELLFLSGSGKNGKSYQVFHTTHSDYDWSKPSVVSALGEFDRENANIEVVNEDGKLFLYDGKKKSLFFSEPEGNSWKTPEIFDAKLTSKNLESHFFINAHEDRIIFAQKNKHTGFDLFETFKDASSGKWSKPVQLPAPVNSDWDEESPFLSPDEQKLYFSSKRIGGVGGYDVYVSTLDAATKTWGEPVNLGWPINSPDDDMNFKMNADQESGYFVSNRIYSKGDYDIFFFWKINKVFVEGKVLNALTEEIVTDGEIRFHPSQYLVEYFRSPIDENGKFRTEIISDEIFRVEVISGLDTLGVEKYQIHDSKGEKLTHVQDFYAVSKNASEEEMAAFAAKTSGVLGEEASSPKVTVATTTPPQNPISEKKAETKPVSTPEPEPIKESEKRVEESTNDLTMLGGKYRTANKAILHNIYFDKGTSQLKKESNETLNELFELLDKNPNLRVEIAGHTDNIGTPDVNQWLSENRAKAVKKWLVKKGINKNRMTTKGYGESRPLASNDDEINGRELNRRIEVLVIE